MPQGPAHLHIRFGDDWVAWLYLKRRGFGMHKFVVTPPYFGYVLSNKEWDAATYLCLEWDWEYDRDGGPERSQGASRLSQARSWLLRVSSGPLRVWDKHLRSWQMWWHCEAKYELRRRWYYVTGRRKEWDEGVPVLEDIAEAQDKVWENLLG